MWELDTSPCFCRRKVSEPSWICTLRSKMSDRGPAGPSGLTVTVSFSPRRSSSSKFVLPLACCTMLMMGRSRRTSRKTTRPAAKSIGLYPSSARGSHATSVESGSSKRTSVSTTPVSNDPRTSPTSIDPATALSTTAEPTRASRLRPARVPTSALSAPSRQASRPTSDQRHLHIVDGYDLVPAFPNLAYVHKQAQPHARRQNGRWESQFGVRNDHRVAAGRSRLNTARHAVARAKYLLSACPVGCGGVHNRCGRQIGRAH